MINLSKNSKKNKYISIQITDYLLIISCSINKFNDEKYLIQQCYANLKISNVEEAFATFIIYDNNENINDIKILHLTKSDYQYHNDLEIEIIANQLKINRTTLTHAKSKIGRNEQCPCGSGKKYKKCCGK